MSSTSTLLWSTTLTTLWQVYYVVSYLYGPPKPFFWGRSFFFPAWQLDLPTSLLFGILILTPLDKHTCFRGLSQSTACTSPVLFFLLHSITHRLSQHLTALSRNSMEQGERDNGDRGPRGNLADDNVKHSVGHGYYCITSYICNKHELSS